MANRVFVTGDTHGWYDIHKLNRDNFIVDSLTKEDILIIAGDVGFVWDGDERDDKKIKWISSRPFTTLVVPGNHENYREIQKYPLVTLFGGRVRKVSDSLYYVERGEILEISGKKYFCFGGAFSHDTEQRMLNIDWFREELPTLEQTDYGLKNLERYHFKVDYIITHDVPMPFLYRLGYGSNSRRMASYREENVLYVDINSFLENVYEMAEFTGWFAGHYHVNKRFEKLQILIDDIVEIDDSCTGYHFLDNVYRKTCLRVFTRDELKERLINEKLFMNWMKIGTSKYFSQNEPKMRAEEYFEQDVSDRELEQITYLYNRYSAQKETFEE